MVSPARRRHSGEPFQLLALRRANGLCALRQEKLSQALDVPAWPAIARAVDKPIGIGQFRFDQRFTERQEGQGTCLAAATLQSFC